MYNGNLKERNVGFYNLSEIRLNSINPPSIANNSINDDIKKIYVPETSLEKYKSGHSVNTIKLAN